MAAHVERTVKKGTRVLDNGAGTGIVGLVATTLGADVTVSYHPLLSHCFSNACWVGCSCQIFRGTAHPGSSSSEAGGDAGRSSC